MNIELQQDDRTVCCGHTAVTTMFILMKTVIFIFRGRHAGIANVKTYRDRQGETGTDKDRQLRTGTDKAKQGPAWTDRYK